jgi:hypothetical protein
VLNSLRAVTKPGDLVALESPTFYGFLQILQSLGLRALEIPTHPRTGISLDALELALAEHPVKAVLVMPNVSNPIGASMSDAAKKRLVELTAANSVPLIEDHIYAELQFDTPAPRPAKAFDRAGNVDGGSFRELAPGSRPADEPAAGATVRCSPMSTGGQNDRRLVVAEMESGGDALTGSCGAESQVDIARVIAESFRAARGHAPAGATSSGWRGEAVTWLFRAAARARHHHRPARCSRRRNATVTACA